MTIIFCFLLTLIASPVHAESTKEKLAQVERKQAQSVELTDQLKKEIDGLVSEQRKLKGALVSLSKELKSQEKKLGEQAHKEARTKENLTEAVEQLDTRREELEAMIQAAVRLSQMPPEAMVMMPEVSGDAMQISRTMSIMADTLKQRAQALRAQITKLKQMRITLAEQREKTQKQLARVSRQRGQLSKKISERARVANKLSEQLGSENTRIKELAVQSKNLKQLMAALKKQDKKKQAAKTSIKTKEVAAYVESAIKSGGSKGKIRSFKSMKGKLKAPSAGKVVSSYKAKGTSELSKGITIETVNGASVSALYDGKVAYAGHFRGYGKLVILKHSQDYFTLVAGLGRIHASMGETLLEGEPVGAMGSKNADKLYVELRKGSDPMNPKGWFAGL